MNKQNVAVVGVGYVGLGVGVMLAEKHDVMMVDVVKEKVDMINGRKSPLKEKQIQRWLSRDVISISATTEAADAYKKADFVIVAVPTNYDEETRKFDTHIVENVVNEVLAENQNAIIVIKSTVPVGFTKGLIERLKAQNFSHPNVLFSPEFLREGTALKDNLYPSRVIVGCEKGDREQSTLAGRYLQLIRSVTKGDYQELIMGSTEAEAVKLFANTYLAMRVAYFNELDTYAELNGLNAKDIIEGMCYDPRIGNQYNNPSFGYGGYCFPKDTKQLQANFNGVPQDLISAIVDSNDTRKKHIAEMIDRVLLSSGVQCPVLGVYRLAMKSGSDNFRQSAVLDIIKMSKYPVCIYEPTIQENEFNGCEVIKDLEKFKQESGLIITNRYDKELDDVKDKVYTRDIFNNN